MGHRLPLRRPVAGQGHHSALGGPGSRAVPRAPAPTPPLARSARARRSAPDLQSHGWNRSTHGSWVVRPRRSGPGRLEVQAQATSLLPLRASVPATRNSLLGIRGPRKSRLALSASVPRPPRGIDWLPPQRSTCGFAQPSAVLSGQTSPGRAPALAETAPRPAQFASVPTGMGSQLATRALRESQPLQPAAASLSLQPLKCPLADPSPPQGRLEPLRADESAGTALQPLRWTSVPTELGSPLETRTLRESQPLPPTVASLSHSKCPLAQPLAALSGQVSRGRAHALAEMSPQPTEFASVPTGMGSQLVARALRESQPWPPAAALPSPPRSKSPLVHPSTAHSGRALPARTHA